MAAKLALALALAALAAAAPAARALDDVQALSPEEANNGTAYNTAPQLVGATPPYCHHYCYEQAPTSCCLDNVKAIQAIEQRFAEASGVYGNITLSACNFMGCGILVRVRFPDQSGFSAQEAHDLSQSARHTKPLLDILRAANLTLIQPTGVHEGGPCYALPWP